MNRLWDELRPLLATLAGLMLLPGTTVALLLLLFIDYVRTRMQHVIGTLIEERLPAAPRRAQPLETLSVQRLIDAGKPLPTMAPAR
jgi:hypothetical protein